MRLLVLKEFGNPWFWCWVWFTMRDNKLAEINLGLKHEWRWWNRLGIWMKDLLILVWANVDCTIWSIITLLYITSIQIGNGLEYWMHGLNFISRTLGILFLLLNLVLNVISKLFASMMVSTNLRLPKNLRWINDCVWIQLLRWNHLLIIFCHALLMRKFGTPSQLMTSKHLFVHLIIWLIDFDKYGVFH